MLVLKEHLNYPNTKYRFSVVYNFFNLIECADNWNSYCMECYNNPVIFYAGVTVGVIAAGYVGYVYILPVASKLVSDYVSKGNNPGGGAGGSTPTDVALPRPINIEPSSYIPDNSVSNVLERAQVEETCTELVSKVLEKAHIEQICETAISNAFERIFLDQLEKTIVIAKKMQLIWEKLEAAKAARIAAENAASSAATALQDPRFIHWLDVARLNDVDPSILLKLEQTISMLPQNLSDKAVYFTVSLFSMAHGNCLPNCLAPAVLKRLQGELTAEEISLLVDALHSVAGFLPAAV